MNDSIEPQRLLDDPAVAGSLRGDLNVAAAAVPLRYDVEAGLAHFQARLTHASSAVGSAASTGGSSIAVGKVVAGVAGLLVVGGAAWALLTGGPDASTPAADEDRVAVVASPEPTHEPAPPPEPASEPVAVVVPDPEPEPSAEPSAEPEPEPPEPEARTRSKRREAPDSTSDILLEAKKVQQAKQALEADPARTLRLLQEIEREFPNGQLTEERDGLYVLALLGAGKTEQGKKRADAYLARHPRGTLATRVRRALAQLP